MDTATFAKPAVVGYSKDFVFAKVDGSVDTLLERTLGIGGHPTVILFKPDGNEVDRLLGFYAADSFMTEINNYLAGINTLDDYLRRVKAAPDDPTLHYALGEKYYARRMWEKSRAHYGKVVELDPKNKGGLADDAAFYVALVFRREKNWDSSIDGFRSLIKSYPESELREDAEVYIPYIYANAGDSTQAVKYYREFLTKYPESKEVDWVKEQITKIENHGSE
jgi:tetratricopeptide (TPR) repeat protein